MIANVFDAIDRLSDLQFAALVFALLCGGGLIVLIVQVSAEVSAHRSWERRQADFSDDHPRDRVGGTERARRR